ncbi:hypothetical protein [Streptomyces sp. NPDC051014]|uniref:hypothetical protein n=1 Tax=Streptomyces sp. NPDC051014 TaxID=3155751 RepID=UPI0033FDAFDB
MSATVTVPAYDPAVPDSAARVVTAHLDQLGIGQHTVRWQEGGLSYVRRDIPPGLGWCRATGRPEALWPIGADLTAEVEWFPDRDVPAGQQAEHWQTRLTAITTALEGLGYVVQRPGPRRTPEVCRSVPMLVYRLATGATADPWPEDGWDHLDLYPEYRWPAQSPGSIIERLLRDGRLGGGITYYARTLDTYQWPAYATAAAMVSWRPPAGADADAWTAAMARVRRLLTAAGYQLLCHPREWRPGIDHRPYLIAYRRDGVR